MGVHESTGAGFVEKQGRKDRRTEVILASEGSRGTGRDRGTLCRVWTTTLGKRCRSSLGGSVSGHSPRVVMPLIWTLKILC